MISNVNNLGDFIMMRGSNSNGNLESNSSLQKELELLLLLQQQQQNRNLILERERELNINRSGSAPPTVEGAVRAAGNLFGDSNFRLFDDSRSSNSNSIGVLTEEEIRSHPLYLEYYYSHENLNPRLPPPLLSKEDWRVAQRVRAAGLGFGNKNLVDGGGSSSLFSMQPGGMSVKEQEEEELMELRKAALRNLSRKNSTDLLDKCSAGASSSGMGVRRKSFADILQEGLGQPVTSQSVDTRGISNLNASEVQNKAESFESMIPEKPYSGLSSQNIGSSSVNSSFTSNGSKLRAKSSNPNLVSVGGGVLLADNVKSITPDAPKVSAPSIFEIADAAASLSGLSISRDQLLAEEILRSSYQMGISHNQKQYLFDRYRAEQLVNGMNYADLAQNNRSFNDLNSLINERLNFPRRASSTTNLQSQINPSDLLSLEDLKLLCQSSNFHGSLMTGTIGDGINLSSSNNVGNQFPIMDPLEIQYLLGRNMGGNSTQGRRLVSPYSHDDFQALEKAYLQALLLQQKQQQSQFLHRPSGINHPYLGNLGVATPQQGNMVRSSSHSKITSRSPTFQNEKSAQFHSNLRNLKGESSSSPNLQSGNNSKGRVGSLLEMVKNNKAKSLELSDVLNHVVEFSMDQYGSRFIQQKLETATDEEKMMIFREINPHARGLMVDVFGNYVIQKFFEHGTEDQRKELAKNLIGHVLALSLQMYGCRVVQKALEVVDVELQTEMVAELDGSVMKCVRDQNGNHVIQKCIEHVPQDRIQFIISSFFGQVLTLSTHPYGCRVIQRVLEHCKDPKTQQLIMEEIMSSVYNLAQDQYGNYVIQHILQHGKPHERSAIISKLAGQIVKMSQQKFASNVVEKCLTFGGLEERKLLVNEMLGSTDENEPLQAMMKDPFGNYVVQKVLETCDDRSRELILSRVKVHLHTLKKYTYGKHIVSRVEKLVATGEKHMGRSSSGSS